MPMKKLFTFVAVAIAAVFSAGATTPNRIVIPDVEGYKTLKGDFHIHTVFSDASVWPTTRVQEAIWEGLDVIAITDHVDTRLLRQLKRGVINPDKFSRDMSYEIAKSAAGDDLIVIHGGEISRGMPPGHWNMLFVEDCDRICEIAEAEGEDNEAVTRAALKEAQRQGGFTMWNHPNWETQAPNETKWWDAHERLYNEGYMQGIEIYNKFCGYSPEAHRWALDRGITMLGNSDCHTPFFYMIDYMRDQHRPITLVFATEKSEEGVREALLNRRTAVYAEEMVYGSEQTLRPLFEACVKIEDVQFNSKRILFKLVNKSSIPVRITKAPGNDSEKYTYVRTYELRPFEEINILLEPNRKDNHRQEFTEKSIDINFVVDNFVVEPGRGLPYTFHFDVPEK